MPLDLGDPIDRVRGATEVERFRSWIRNGGGVIDRDKYLINHKECVDYFIRFETMPKDIKNVCRHLTIPFESSRIPELKKGFRPHGLPINEYYDHETETIVREKYAWEFERFGYDLPK